MSKTTIIVVTDPGEFESLAPLWNNLLERGGDENTMYLTHEWLATRWRHLGEGRKLNLLLFERDRQVIGIMPLVRNEYRLGPFRLDALESIGGTSRNYVGLMAPEDREEVISALLDYLKENLGGINLILRLSLVPSDSQFLRALKSGLAQLSEDLAFEERLKTLAPYIDLPVSWDEYFGSLRGKRRKMLGRMRRRLEEEQGAVSFRQCDAGSLEEGLNRFFDLHQERWRAVGISGSFADPRVREFYSEAAWKFLKRGWLYFSSMEVGGRLVSAAYSCIFNRNLYVIAYGRDIRYSRYSVGHLHEMHNIRDAISRNLGEFDFLQGDEPYKFYWTKSARKYMRITIIKKGFLAGLRLQLLRAFLRLWDVRQYSPREIWAILSMRRRERKEHKQMGLLYKLEKLKKG
jgi:CelD/BcsL family acetyltransferase involved in cellulose biosynthesis